MRAYGVRLKDGGCCPGHDKAPTSRYRAARWRRLVPRLTVLAHKRARRTAKAAIRRAGM